MANNNLARRGRILAALTLLLMCLCVLVPSAYADDLDPLGGNDAPGTSQTVSPNDDKNSGQIELTPEEEQRKKDVEANSNNAKSLVESNPLRDYNPRSLPFSGAMLDAIGVVTSFVLWVGLAFIFLNSALGVVYIEVPFLRPWLADPNEDGQGNSIGGGYGGYGGFGGGMADQSQKKSLFNRQWVPDSAVHLVKQYGGSSQAYNGGFGGGYRGGGFGGGYAGQPEPAANTKKNIMWEYGKDRIGVLITLGIIVVLLFSSFMFDFGVDLGGFILRLFGALLDKVQGYNIEDVFHVR